MTSYEKKILEHLIDKYENSKSFIGANVVKQNFTVNVSALFPEYTDESRYELFATVNKTVDSLELQHFIIVKRQKNGVISTITLNQDQLEKCYLFMGRTPKKDVQSMLNALLQKYEGNNDVLDAFCHDQEKRISLGKKVEHYDGDIKKFENVLKSLSKIFDVQTETYQRDFSVRALGDSKAFEGIRSKVESILFEYGDFAEKTSILEELNIIKNPGHIYFKGNGKITIKGQTLDFSVLNGDFAISSALLQDIETIEVLGNAVITVENLTTFNSFANSDMFAIYLGGYHNSNRRDFIKKIYSQNQNKQYYHYGDIDAGGFYILQHLRRKTEVPFMPYHMDVNTLLQFSSFTKNLTENDRKRLNNLLDTEFHDVVKYMLENNCKLEQEAVDLY